MIEYLKYAGYFICILIGTVILGLAIAKIFDMISFVTNKLGDLIFGKERNGKG